MERSVPACQGPAVDPLVQALSALVRATSPREATRAYMQAWALPGVAPGDQVGVLLAEVHELAREVHSLRALAQQDELTSVANRRALNAALERELARATRTGAPISVIMLDLDGLKRINDRSGHATGDQAIQRLAGCCVAAARRSDLVARLGGDEFAVLLPDADEAAAAAVQQRVRRLIKQVRIAGHPLAASCGAATAWPRELRPEQLLARADAQLYRDKRRGDRLPSAPATAATDQT
ncbi:MAG: GGDEF domain-containing protein [Proteobacteria bacterium]|nr:GGDEF domain-containing protein [Pseudomonadota bacterium]